MFLLSSSYIFSSNTKKDVTFFSNSDKVYLEQDGKMIFCVFTHIS